MRTIEYGYYIIEGPTETSTIRVTSSGWCVIKETWEGTQLLNSQVVFSNGSKVKAESEMKRLQDTEA